MFWKLYFPFTEAEIMNNAEKITMWNRNTLYCVRWSCMSSCCMYLHEKWYGLKLESHRKFYFQSFSLIPFCFLFFFQPLSLSLYIHIMLMNHLISRQGFSFSYNQQSVATDRVGEDKTRERGTWSNDSTKIDMRKKSLRLCSEILTVSQRDTWWK